MNLIEFDAGASPRVHYGAQLLAKALGTLEAGPIIIGRCADEHVQELLAEHGVTLDERAFRHEGYALRTLPDGSTLIAGGDDSGCLYGCLDLASQIANQRKLPNHLNVADAPRMTLRGPAFGMQKTFLMPGRKVYEYPYTPELFPFFYDRTFWREYLDFLCENRFNTLYIWSGHPFSSLVKIPGYEYALEVDDATFEKNVSMFRYIAQEADKRGVWVVQKFYSLLLPKPLADKHGMETQLSAPNPLAADYTRKCVAAFIQNFPSVGLMVCLGEALQGQDNQKYWLNDVILPGVKDGMAAAGITAEPPIVVRTHATDLRKVLPETLGIYKNIYTEAKFNGESLTTHEPRGRRQEVHQAMSKLVKSHLMNVHILANLEPFRYGAQRFIKKCVQAGLDRLGANGLHLYPLAFWSFPEAPDAVEGGLKQIERDWIWFAAWARYAWNPDIDETEDHAYWIDQLARRYGTAGAAEGILDAYNDSGECAPRLLRRFGITEGNRQTMSLGMTLDQLVNPERHRPFPELWESQSPPGERLPEYADREWNKQPHEGETPPQILAEVLAFAESAVEAADRAAPLVTKNRAEFDRINNDMYCIQAMSQSYASKVEAAMLVLRFKHSNDLADLEKAAEHLEQSLEAFRRLVGLTDETYKFANTMQTGQRSIPFKGGLDGKPINYHWRQVLPLYEQEFEAFKQELAERKAGTFGKSDEDSIASLKPADYEVINGGEAYKVGSGARVYTDRPYVIQSVAPELIGLNGIAFPHENAKLGKPVDIELSLPQPVKVLVGYFKHESAIWLKVPDLETDAAAADTISDEPIIQNAATIESVPGLNIHTVKVPAGRHKLDLRGRGSFVILGVVADDTVITPRDAKRPGAQ